MAITYRMANADETDLLLDLWESSVRWTHDFLTESDIQELKKQLATYLQENVLTVSVLLVDEQLAGFAQVSSNHLNMLFLAPKFIGKGLGKSFFDYLLINHPFNYLEVNESNPKALEFYQKQGFVIDKITSTDECGRPFPLIYMKKHK